MFTINDDCCISVFTELEEATVYDDGYHVNERGRRKKNFERKGKKLKKEKREKKRRDIHDIIIHDKEDPEFSIPLTKEERIKKNIIKKEKVDKPNKEKKSKPTEPNQADFLAQFLKFMQKREDTKRRSRTRYEQVKLEKKRKKEAELSGGSLQNKAIKIEPGESEIGYITSSPRNIQSNEMNLEKNVKTEYVIPADNRQPQPSAPDLNDYHNQSSLTLSENNHYSNKSPTMNNGHSQTTPSNSINGNPDTLSLLPNRCLSNSNQSVQTKNISSLASLINPNSSLTSPVVSKLLTSSNSLPYLQNRNKSKTTKRIKNGGAQEVKRLGNVSLLTVKKSVHVGNVNGAQERVICVQVQNSSFSEPQQTNTGDSNVFVKTLDSESDRFPMLSPNRTLLSGKSESSEYLLQTLSDTVPKPKQIVQNETQSYSDTDKHIFNLDQGTVISETSACRVETIQQVPPICLDDYHATGSLHQQYLHPSKEMSFNRPSTSSNDVLHSSWNSSINGNSPPCK